MKFEETATKMLDEDYKERFKAEYFQVSIRLTKLKKVLNDFKMGKLDFNPTCPFVVLDKQAMHMQQYLDDLTERAAIEGIKLHD